MDDSYDKVEEAEKIKALLKHLIGAVRSISLYPVSHPIVKGNVANLSDGLSRLFGNRENITFGIVGNELVSEDLHLSNGDKFCRWLIEKIKSHEVEKISFLKGVAIEELDAFITAVASDPGSLGGGLTGALARKNVRHIKVGCINLEKDDGKKEENSDADVSSGEKAYLDAVEVIKNMTEDLNLGKRINAGDVKDVIHSMVKMIREDASALLNLATLKGHDDYTFTHSVDVSILTLIQVETLGFDDKMLNDIGSAALLHDTGKLLVPGEIIRKPGKLEPHEWEIMKKHPVNGAKTLAKTPGLSDLASIVAFEHHQKHDRSGYPEQPGKESLNLISMMTAIADVFDALRSKRPYSPEIPPEKAAEIMTSLSGKDFEPALLKRFMQMVGVYPPGTIVRLDTGEVGIVDRTNPRDALRPRLKIILSDSGLKKANPETVELTEKDRVTGAFKRCITGSVADPAELGIVPQDYY